MPALIPLHGGAALPLRGPHDSLRAPGAATRMAARAVHAGERWGVMATRIGVDIGGTFTDLIYYDDVSGESLVAKVPTTPDNPDEGVVNAIGQAVPADRVQAAEYFLHGTTVGINALLQRRGAVVGLLATEGFRDILEIRRGDREEMYNLFWTPPPPLVPRRLRRPVKERIRANGEVHTAQETGGCSRRLSGCSRAKASTPSPSPT